MVFKLVCRGGLRDVVKTVITGKSKYFARVTYSYFRRLYLCSSNILNPKNLALVIFKDLCSQTFHTAAPFSRKSGTTEIFFSHKQALFLLPFEPKWFALFGSLTPHICLHVAVEIPLSSCKDYKFLSEAKGLSVSLNCQSPACSNLHVLHSRRFWEASFAADW